MVFTGVEEADVVAVALGLGTVLDTASTIALVGETEVAVAVAVAVAPAVADEGIGPLDGPGWLASGITHCE